MLSGENPQLPEVPRQVQLAWPRDDWSNLTVLVAVSGGPDSVALLRAITQLRPSESQGEVAVAHYNHRWRGEESEGDEAFVRELAATLDFRCEVGRADDRLSLRERTHFRGAKGDNEESARNERYAFLLETAHRLGARYVATGHTFDDQAETILFRLIRGTGLSGLTGMPAARTLSPAVTLIRPLLSVRRAEILDYLSVLNQPFRTDASNADVRFARNRLRHEVLPRMQELSSSDVAEHLVQLGRQAKELLAPIRAVASRLLESAEFTGSRVQLRRIPCDRQVVREMFVEIWKRQGWPRGEMTFERWEELAEAFVSGSTPSRMFPGKIRAAWVGDELVIGSV